MSFDVFNAIRKCSKDEHISEAMVLLFERMLYATAQTQFHKVGTEDPAYLGGMWQTQPVGKTYGYLAYKTEGQVRVMVASNYCDVTTNYKTACAAATIVALNHLCWWLNNNNFLEESAKVSSLFYRIKGACFTKKSGLDTDALYSIID